MIQIIDPRVEFLDGDSTNPFVVKKTQEIPQEFLDAVKDAKFATSNAPMGNYHRAASIPTVIHEKWLREGFDCTQAPLKETLARLRREGLEAFITTTKHF